MNPATLLNRFSLRQAMIIVTLAAIVAAILREIRLDSGMAYSILLAPLCQFLTLHVLAMFVRPVGKVASRPVGVQAAVLLLCLLVVLAMAPLSVAIIVATKVRCPFWLQALILLLPVGFWLFSRRELPITMGGERGVQGKA